MPAPRAHALPPQLLLPAGRRGGRVGALRGGERGILKTAGTAEGEGAPASPGRPGEETREKILLLGTPNVGKSALFAALTGLRAQVSNYPGTTVEVSRGWLPDGAELLDTPGLASLLPASEEERVARDLLLESDRGTAVVVADKKNLPRGLALALQLGEMEIPCVLCLNMADEARARGIHVDARALEEEIGIPVVKTVATRRRGTLKLRRAIRRAARCTARVNYGRDVEEAAAQVEERIDGTTPGGRGLALLFLSGDRTLAGPLRERLGEEALREAEEIRFRLSAAAGEPVSATIQRLRFSRAQAIAARVTRRGGRRRGAGRLRLAERFGDLALHPLWGKLILAGALLAMFWLVGLLGAGVMVDFLETAVFGEAIVPAAIAATDLVLPFPHEHARETVGWELTVPLTPAHEIPTGLALSRETIVPDYEMKGEVGPVGQALRFLHDLLVGEFGLLTMGIPYALAIVLPIVAVFFFVLGILEDSGYLPRLAVVVNRAFRTIGLNGKAVLPMVLGLGCVTMATLTTRILETRKQRLLTVFLLALGIPCSAQLGVVLGLLATVSPAAVIVWAGALAAILLAVGWLAARVVPGEDTPLVLEIPPIRLPSLSNLTKKTIARVEWYLREAVPLFLLGTFVLFLGDRTGALGWLERFFAPLVTGLLGLPKVATTAFLVGFLRRDYGAVFLMDAARDGLLEPGQVLVAALVVTLFVPCIATVFLVGREWGWKIAGAVVAIVFALAFLLGGAVNGILAVTGWSP